MGLVTTAAPAQRRIRRIQQSRRFPLVNSRSPWTTSTCQLLNRSIYLDSLCPMEPNELASRWRERNSWRRLERRAVRSHEIEITSRLTSLAGRRLEVDLSVRGAPGLLMDFPNWRIALLIGVIPRVVLDLERLSTPDASMYLEAAGRYQRFWWVRVGRGTEHLTILGAHLVVASRWGDGGDCRLSFGLAPNRHMPCEGQDREVVPCGLG
jgi:hypothetical protein